MVRWKLVTSAYRLYSGVALTFSSRLDYGTNVYEKDWDVLVLLDTCRIDALRTVANEYDFLDEIGPISSVGSTSSEWIANTFTTEYRDEVRNTAYLSTNGHVKTVFRDREFPDEDKDALLSFAEWDVVYAEDFELLEETWRYLPGHPYSRFDPRGVTDRAITVHRDFNPDRLILHYIQPHPPYCSKLFDQPDYELKPWEETPFEYLRGGGNFDRVWDAYLDELRYVLNEIELLLENVNADTVAISADHGEAFGELGVLYGHPAGVPHPAVRRVPWAETSGTDRGTYEPTIEPAEDVDADVDEHLRALGYK